MSVMPVDLAPVIAATARWLARAYPAPQGGAFNAALVELQARQAATVAAWLRYPSAMDAELLMLAGPGGSTRLDWLVGAEADDPEAVSEAWRAWVDEVVASWAVCLLVDAPLAALAVATLSRTSGAVGLPLRFRRLLDPDQQDRQASALLRHPDLADSIAGLHREALCELVQRNVAPRP